MVTIACISFGTATSLDTNQLKLNASDDSIAMFDTELSSERFRYGTHR